MYYMGNVYHNTEIHVPLPQIYKILSAFQLIISETIYRGWIIEMFQSCSKIVHRQPFWVIQVPKSSSEVPLLDSMLESDLLLRKRKKICIF